MAIFWVSYDFSVNGEFILCGTIVFDLTKNRGLMDARQYEVYDTVDGLTSLWAGRTLADGNLLSSVLGSI